jgi:hypothetical protein
MRYTVDENEGYCSWYKKGTNVLHREDGPAYTSGSDKHWYKDGVRHREDGPAIEFGNGSRFWYLNGKRHREDGPAVEYINGTKFWYLDDFKYTEVGYHEKMKEKTISSCDGKVVEIDGKKYKLSLV